jgi:hypothetical protein
LISIQIDLLIINYLKFILNVECITAESYIKQYNNWCDEFTRYQRALNDWEDMRDKTCSSSGPAAAAAASAGAYSATANGGGN